MSLEVILGGAVLATTLIGIGIQYRKAFGDLRKEICDRMDIVEKRVQKLETKLEPFWNLLVGRMADILKSPHTPRMDVLLDKVKSNLLKDDEIFELHCLIEDKLNNGEASEKDVIAGNIILAYLDTLKKG